jgi:uncharacterized protein (AIM24 family)
MHPLSLTEFAAKTAEKPERRGAFELENERLLEINLNGSLWTKTGSMVAYIGGITFTREGILEHGIGRMLKKTFSGEGTRLTKAEGQGRLYLADNGKKITLLRLAGDSLCVNGNDLLAFEESITWDIRMMRRMTALVAGGLFNVRLEGSGTVALTTHFDPLTLRVTPTQPVITDPNATVAWSGGLTPEFRTDISLGTFFGRGSGESIQMEFKGDGFVVVQPCEELALQRSSGAHGAGG